MPAARATWTDERLDDLSRFDAMQRIMLQLGGGTLVTFAVGFAGLIAAGH